MNECEKDPVNQAEGRQVQQELEDQLRAFGDTVSDAFAHGFEGRGEDIGDRAYGVGKAAVHAANFGIGEAAKAFRQGRDEYYRSRSRQKAQSGAPGQKKQGLDEDAINAQAAGVSGWFQQMFGKAELTPVEKLRKCAKERYSAGVALLAIGITFAVIFGTAGISCLAVAGAAVPLAQTVEGSMMYALGGGLLSSVGMTALEICGNVFTLAACGFGWMTARGIVQRLAGKRMGQMADMAEGMDYQQGLSVEMLADLTHQKKSKTLKALRKYIRKGWLRAWLDEKTQTLYLTAEDYRAAQEAAAAPIQQPEPAAAPETDETEKAPLNLETARRFAEVLAKEQQVMQDEQAREELEHMKKTTTAICDWLEAHPESLPKARRFAEYYIPTTLKLLHTYNDVQGQQGENAENIRRDIAGILHTLNKAYDTLYDTLLSDVAMDVSSEIAALQGMLANDGLTGREFE